ncbi:MAG: hypothetical protein P9M06_05370 [Candidatus Saelkia tenebricola]|nr:hypothetical protein [Candidatus Saelkia tenebricola]
MEILNFWFRHKKKLQVAMIVSMVLFVLEVAIRRPKQVNELLEEFLKLRKKNFKVQIPKIIKLEQYLKAIAGKEMFLREERKPEDISNSISVQLSEFEFNGIIQLEKPYVAILKKKTSQQLLVPEGGTFEGIKIKKINPESVIIEHYGQEKVIIF